jgi:ABC-type nitrate/sulfonate/bicarbonate transport system ATPase subunit
MASVTARGLGLTYPARAREAADAGGTIALADLDLAIADGEPVAVIGPSGCGKSTLLLAIAGLGAPTTGELLVAGDRVDGPRLRTALILQDFGLLPWKTVRQNAELGLTIRGVPAADRRARGERALADVGLAEVGDSYPAELSGGMRQRVAIARALALEADLLLMDEPLSALDALTREELQDLLLALWTERGMTMLLVTHSIEEAVFLGRRIVVMTPAPGRVAAIIDNPSMGTEGYRQTAEFHALTDQLRDVLAAEGALGGRRAAGAAAGAAHPGAPR